MKAYYTQALEFLIYYLKKEGTQERWVQWLNKDLDEFYNSQDVTHHLQAYGGMSSFNDICFQHLSSEEKDLFGLVKAYCYRYAFFYQRIKKDIQDDILQEVLQTNQNKQLSTIMIEGLYSGDLLGLYISHSHYHKLVPLKLLRDSVCLGDDYFNNTQVIICNMTLPCRSLISIAKENHFLPSVSGNDVVWVVKNHKGQEILSYFTKEDKIILHTIALNLQYACENVNEFHFVYYPSPQARGREIFNIYKGSRQWMWNDGVIDEYECCHINKQLEQQWKDE